MNRDEKHALKTARMDCHIKKHVFPRNYTQTSGRVKIFRGFTGELLGGIYLWIYDSVRAGELKFVICHNTSYRFAVQLKMDG